MKRGPKERTGTGNRIMKHVRAGKLTPNQIAKACDVTPSAVRYYKRMFARGLAK